MIYGYVLTNLGPASLEEEPLYTSSLNNVCRKSCRWIMWRKPNQTSPLFSFKRSEGPQYAFHNGRLRYRLRGQFVLTYSRLHLFPLAKSPDWGVILCRRHSRARASSFGATTRAHPGNKNPSCWENPQPTKCRDSRLLPNGTFCTPPLVWRTGLRYEGAEFLLAGRDGSNLLRLLSLCICALPADRASRRRECTRLRTWNSWRHQPCTGESHQLTLS
ncbi:hypothetical protein BCR34DRAFT_193819 [Clohesyomyces aquaticus]|uniref:Uncharacterized protein n=1 Tax=Clohesyomyces aquaticus TaxID=1231657 RepID=A0A1Y1YCG7_9PLEO|nr:hypothetical protein BCR34DRAFT_193819 [Clohesyomyces aquaticus]